MKSDYVITCTDFGWRASLLAGIIVSSLHLALASIYIDHPPFWDEMYHMLAAESWRDRSELSILDGEYTRTATFTKLVALHSYLCGPSLECARSLSLIASALLVFLVTFFVSIKMSFAAGIVGGLLVALNPAVVVAAQAVRFYSLHALIFLLFSFVLYFLLTRWKEIPIWISIFLAGIIFILLISANYLQQTTQIGLMGTAMAAFLISVPELSGWLKRQSIFLIVLILASLALFIVTVLYLVDFQEKIEMLRWTPGWAQGLEHAYLYYYYSIRSWYPALWPLAGFLSLLSIARWPRFTIYCLTTFVICFVLLSVAGTKGDRYIVFVLPFIIIPMSGGIVVAFEIISNMLATSLKSSPLLKLMDNNRLQLLAVLIVILVTFGYITAQPLVRASVRMVLHSGYENLFGNYGSYADWQAAANVLREMKKEYPIVLSSSGVKAAWYLKNFDFEINYSVMLETDTADEFGIDPRTGRPVISSPESLKQILQEYESLLVIIEDIHANSPRAVPIEVIQILDEKGARVETTAQNLRVWIIPKPHYTQITD